MLGSYDGREVDVGVRMSEVTTVVKLQCVSIRAWRTGARGKNDARIRNDSNLQVENIRRGGKYSVQVGRLLSGRGGQEHSVGSGVFVGRKFRQIEVTVELNAEDFTGGHVDDARQSS